MILPDLPTLNFDGDDSASNGESLEPLPTTEEEKDTQKTIEFTMNFDSLFESFGRILHTEVGALMFYSLLKASPSFSETLVARSDSDTLVLPLLRTLYCVSE